MANGKNTAAVLSFGELITDKLSRARYPLGTIREQDGKKYRFSKYDNGTGNLAAVSGNVAFHILGDDIVTMDVSDTDVSAVAGAFISVPADGEYFWLQVYGVATLNTAGGDAIVKGDALQPTAADGVVERFAVTTPTAAEVRAIADNGNLMIALADDNDGANTVLAYLRIG